MKQLFVTTSVYALAHELGMQGAIDEVKRQLDYPDENSLAVVRTIARLRTLIPDGLQLHVDGGATYIGQARCRAFHEAFKSGSPWVTIDDDIECTTSTLVALLDAIDEVAPRVVFVPYTHRDGSGKLTCTLPTVRVERQVNGATLAQMPPRQGGGFGLVAMNRPAMQAIVDFAEEETKAAIALQARPDGRVSDDINPRWFERHPIDLHWRDADGETKLALFYERLEDSLWWGEDTSFFRFRIPEGVTVEALLTGMVKHAGFPLNLSTL